MRGGSRAMRRRAELVRAEVEAELSRHFAWLGCGDLSTAGAGLECVGFRARSPVLGEVAIKSPWVRWISNGNDGALDARDLLRQEYALLEHAAAGGVPAPTLHALPTSGARDLLITEFLEHDDTPVDWFQVGAAVRRIHRLPVPELRPVYQGTASAADVLAERLVRRLAVVASASGVPLVAPDAGRLRRALDWPGARRSLLHMDVRPANLLARAGALRGIVDWSNALIGDPALDLARSAEYGWLTDAFLAGYGEPRPFDRVPATVEALFRLDTAVMLAVVFLSAAPQPEAARRQLERIEHLLAEFAATSA